LHFLLFSVADLDCDSSKSVIEVKIMTVDSGFNWALVEIHRLARLIERMDFEFGEQADQQPIDNR
jgi:hypothetical protein